MAYNKHRYLQFIDFWAQLNIQHPSLFQQYHCHVLFSSCGVICPFRVSTNCDDVTPILNAKLYHKMSYVEMPLVNYDVIFCPHTKLLEPHSPSGQIARRPRLAVACSVIWLLRWKEILAGERPHQRWRDVATPINFWWAIISLMKWLKSKTNFVIAVMIHEHQGLLTVCSGWHFD